MKLLNVFFFAVAGFIGLKILLAMLSRLEAASSGAVSMRMEPDRTTEVQGGDAQAGPAKPLPRPAAGEKTTASTTFLVWVVIYALVGAQMGWILRPFVGSPDLSFQLLRGREANFFIDVLRTLGQLFGR